MEGVCATCLTVGRRLAPLKIDASTFSSWFGVNIADPICWECQATLFRFIFFRNRVTVAQDTLQKREAKFQSLSQLSYVSKDSYDEIIIQRIKTEVLDCPIECNPIDTYGGDAQIVKIENDGTSLPASYCKTVVNTFSGDFIEGFKSEVLDCVINCSDKDCTDDDNEQNIILENDSKCLPASYRTVLPAEPKVNNIVKVGNIKEKAETLSSDYYKIKKLTMEEVEQLRRDDLAAERYLKYLHKCQTCILGYPCKTQLDTHNTRLHSDNSGSHVCNICQQRFKREDILKNHHSAHFKCYVCLHCDFAHTRYDLIHIHHLKKHNKDGYRCNICPKDCVFPTFNRLKYHQTTMHKERPICPVFDCGKTFKTNYILKNHMIQHNGGTPQLECKICHKQVRGANNLKTHMKTHTDPPPPLTDLPYCITCDKQFSSRSNYDQHMKYSAAHRNPDILKYECALCGKRFTEKSSLEYHMMSIHLNKRDFICNICQKTFNTKRNLNRHCQSTHDGPREKTKNNVCEHCGKSFIAKKTLREHINTHTGARPFQCQVCGDRFSFSSSLYTHNRLKHECFKRKNRNTMKKNK